MKRLPIVAMMAAFFAWMLWSVSMRQALLFLVGIGLGVALAGQRFGFTTAWRILVEDKNPSGVFGQLIAFGLAAVLCMPLLGHYSELTAALGPPSVSLLIGAFTFGLCMQVADGCGSGVFYKAGMGIPLNTAILPLFALGSFLGSWHLGWWLELGRTEPVGFVSLLGWQRALALTLLALALIGTGVAWYTRRWHRARGQAAPSPWARKWVVGAIMIALFAALVLFISGNPWGIIYAPGLWVAKMATAAGVVDPARNWFWSLPDNAAILQQTVLLDVTTITNIGILAGALWVSAGKPAAHKPMTGRQWSVALFAGLLLGYSSRLAFGCNIGAMFSGISTGSVHGWIWAPMAFAGTIFGLRIRRRLGY
ncbi:YeeE/YedE family protein [Comamonas sp. NLF-1-9]|uniref:YeeE/YedE family protein n=1 Tax=Comamonas sp. NLF-1-9 TaxID=2853163 RepID=UPI001C464207|nr:YeeE/YedE family protein [Comamonas sp. NLF-1-9]QXL85477.1 YeeE/YedE family protein [Comamonas sp. NLF-1-9]